MPPQIPAEPVQINTSATKRTLWAWTVATFFGIGRLRPGPGTYGSAAAVVLWYVAAHITHPGRLTLSAFTAAAALAATAIGIPAASITARESGRKDPGFVIIDEVAGQWFTLLAARPDARHVILAFVLFRLFDITKPWPIRRLEALPEGTGILLDDVAAGLLAAAVLAILSHWL